MNNEKKEIGLQTSKALLTFEVRDDENNLVTRIHGTELVYMENRTLVFMGEDCVGSFNEKFNVSEEYDKERNIVMQEIINEGRPLKIKDKLTDADDSEMRDHLYEYLCAPVSNGRQYDNKHIIDLIDKVSNQGMRDLQENIIAAFNKYTNDI